MKYIIYLVTNKINSKYYVGYTSRELPTRWKEHCYPSATEENRHLSRAIKKFGSENFSLEVLSVVDSEFEALSSERIWIILLESHNPEIGYNLTLGGDGLSCPSEQTRKKMSDSHKGKVPSKSTLEKRSVSMRKAWVKRKERGDHLQLIAEGKKVNDSRRGKTYEQIFGVSRASRIAGKQAASHAKHKTPLVPVTRETTIRNHNSLVEKERVAISQF